MEKNPVFSMDSTNTCGIYFHRGKWLPNFCCATREEGPPLYPLRILMVQHVSRGVNISVVLRVVTLSNLLQIVLADGSLWGERTQLRHS